MLKNLFGKKTAGETPPSPRDTAPATPAKEGESGKKVLFFHLKPMGWACRFQDSPETAKLTPPQSWEAEVLEEEGQARIERLLKEAVHQLGKTAFKEADEICLLVSEMGLLYSDNNHKKLHAASGLVARQFGQNLLNAKEVTYGYSDFPTVGEKDREDKHGFYAFADSNDIRTALTLLDQTATKVREITPISHMLALRAFDNPRAVYGAINVGAHMTCVVLMNVEQGALLVRTLPIGVMTLARTISEKLAMPLEESVKALSSRSVAKVAPDSGEEGERPRALSSGGRYEQALKPLLSQLLQRINESLDYFDNHRLAGRPGTLELVGSHPRINGLDQWLDTHLSQTVLPVNDSLLDAYAQVPHPTGCNLLVGAESSLLTVGKTRYFFTDKGFQTNKPMPTGNGTGGPINAGTRRSQDRTSRRRQRSERRRRDRGGGIFSALAGLLGGARTAETQSPLTMGQDQAEKNAKQERQFFVLLAAIVAGILFWGYDELSHARKRYQIISSAFIDNRASNDRLSASQRYEKAQSVLASADVTKVLWTEKFIALADNMDEHLWFTDVYLSHMEREVGGTSVSSKKMVIEGRVLPSTVGHIERIGAYMQRLLDDKRWFMIDFDELTFNGAEITESDDEPLIHFSLEAWYDKGKRKRVFGAELGKKGSQGGSVGQMQDAVSQRERHMQETLSGGRRN